MFAVWPWGGGLFYHDAYRDCPWSNLRSADQRSGPSWTHGITHVPEGRGYLFVIYTTCRQFSEAMMKSLPHYD